MPNACKQAFENYHRGDQNKEVCENGINAGPIFSVRLENTTCHFLSISLHAARGDLLKK